MKRKSNETERGQAYTLEGFISAMVVLVAILLALQSVVITPTTGGAADRTVQAQMQQEAQDALVVAANDTDQNSLSQMVRYWDGDGGFEGTDDSLIDPNDNHVYSPDDFSEESELGEILYDRFDERGQNYNVELHYNNESDETESRSLVYQGSPSSNAVSASYTVSLYDDQEVVDSEGTLSGYESGDSETLPQLDDSNESDVYNVVEVRVIVW